MANLIASYSIYISLLISWVTFLQFGYPAKKDTSSSDFRDLSFKKLARVVWCDVGFARFATSSLVSISYFIAIVAFWQFNISNLVTRQFDFSTSALVSIFLLIIFRITLELFVSLSIIAENSNLIVEGLDRDGSIRRPITADEENNNESLNEGEASQNTRLSKFLDEIIGNPTLIERFLKYYSNGDYPSIIAMSKKTNSRIILADVNRANIELHQDTEGRWHYNISTQN